MSELFVIFKQHLVWALMLWVLFFVAFAALFAGRQLTTFAAGVARVLAGIFVTPFVFIRRAVQSVLRFDRAEEEAYRASDQYLLNKAMLVLQALVIVIAIGVFAAGAVATWNAWVPPSEVRREARELRAKVVEQRATSGTADAALAKLESEWAQKRDVVVTKFRRERESRVAAAQKNIAATEEIFAQYGSPRGTEKFAELQAYVQQITRTPDNIRETKERLDRMVAYSWGLVGWEDQTLRAWNERWETKALAEYELANVPMDVLRAEEQPAYEQTKATAERESSTLAALEAQSKQWDEAASLKWKAAAWRLGGAFVTFLAFVWLWGALIEAGWLAIRIADDVRRMREAAPRPVPVPEATQPEVRMPIRESAEPPLIRPSGTFSPVRRGEG